MSELSEKDLQTFQDETEAKNSDKVKTTIGTNIITGKGGYRPNAGRPRGSRNKLTKDAKVREKTIKERILKNVDDLVNSQLALAKGLNFLYQIKMRNVAGRRKPEHIRVTDPKEIKAFLDGDREGEYFYVSSQAPDNKAIDSLLDRAFGKATTEQNINHDYQVVVIDYKKNDQIETTATEVRTEDDSDTSELSAKTVPIRVPGSDPEI
jgi:hypothetical protein